jgi:Protein of unknown function (DUF3347)
MNKFVLAVAVFVAIAVPAVAAELPTALVQPYLKAQVLLSTDQFKGITEAAKEVETAAAALGKDADAMVAGAKKMGAAKTIAEARSAFGSLSEALEAYVKKTNSTLPADIHLAYCPMEDKPWLQKGKEIKNPYYGSQMLDCGSIKK